MRTQFLFGVWFGLTIYLLIERFLKLIASLIIILCVFRLKKKDHIFWNTYHIIVAIYPKKVVACCSKLKDYYFLDWKTKY